MKISSTSPSSVELKSQLNAFIHPFANKYEPHEDILIVNISTNNFMNFVLLYWHSTRTYQLNISIRSTFVVIHVTRTSAYTRLKCKVQTWICMWKNFRESLSYLLKMNYACCAVVVSSHLSATSVIMMSLYDYISRIYLSPLKIRCLLSLSSIQHRNRKPFSRQFNKFYWLWMDEFICWKTQQFVNSFEWKKKTRKNHGVARRYSGAKKEQIKFTQT